MFDRGLIGFGDEHEILVSRHVNDRDSIEALINRTGRMLLPGNVRDRPHPMFLAWHRENRFKA
jgi:putative restriction endonuclease